MSANPADYRASWWAKNLAEVDKEIVRLATICNVRLLDPGIIERVLHKDATVCGTENAVAFDKLRSMLMMHYRIRDKAVDAVGDTVTAAVVKEIVDKIRERVGDRLGGGPTG